MAVPEGIWDSIAAEDLKTNAGASAYYAAARFSDHTSHQKRMDQIAESNATLSGLLFGRLGRTVVEVDPSEAVSTARMMSSDLPQIMANLGTAVAGIQQLLKGAQTSLPESGQGK